MDKVGDTDMKVARGRSEIVPRDFAAAVKDIKLAILQSRARAAHASNVEALKLYFYVGGYVSKKTRTAKWGSGAIDALSNRLQVELPGLRGFSASNIKSMRIFYEAWKNECQIRQTTSAESVSQKNRPQGELSLRPIRQMPFAELGIDPVAAFLSVGFSLHRAILAKAADKDEIWYYILLSAKNQWNFIELTDHLRADDYHHIGALPNNFAKTISPMAQATRAVRSFRDKSKPLGIATYKTLKAIPKPYRSLAPVIEGVRRKLANGLKERAKKKTSRRA